MRRMMFALSLCLSGVSMGACSSASQSVTSPSAVKCGITATATPASFSSSGGDGTLTVSAARECQWTAAAAGNWIQLGGSAQGQGETTVPFKVAANADPSTRKGTISVGDQQVGITQDAAPCVFTVNPRNDSVTADGGQKQIAVTASSPQCTWTARSNADWMTIASGAQATGTGVVRYEARATTGPARTGTLQVAGATVTVAQASGCRYAISPASQAVVTEGGSGSIAVNGGTGCGWTAVSRAPWIAITGGSAGTGTGTVTFTVAANAMGVPARSGTITVHDQTFTVSQAAGPPCVYKLGATAQEFAALPGGLWSFAVLTAPACGWTASSNAPWVVITSGASGAGNGIVVFNVSTNPAGSPARVAAISVSGGLSFAVIQDAALP
jgi:hypothetical protein